MSDMVYGTLLEALIGDLGTISGTWYGTSSNTWYGTNFSRWLMYMVWYRFWYMVDVHC
jgi:hypothetical protein